MSKKITFVWYENNNELDEGSLIVVGVTLQQVLIKTIFDNHTKLECMNKR